MLLMRIDGKLPRFSDDTRLGVLTNRLSDRIKFQKHFNSLKQCARTNEMTFNRDQCRALLSGQVPKYKMREIGERPRVFADSKFKVDQQNERAGQLLQPYGGRVKQK